MLRGRKREACALERANATSFARVLDPSPSRDRDPGHKTRTQGGGARFHRSFLELLVASAIVPQTSSFASLRRNWTTVLVSSIRPSALLFPPPWRIFERIGAKCCKKPDLSSPRDNDAETSSWRFRHPANYSFSTRVSSWRARMTRHDRERERERERERGRYETLRGRITKLICLRGNHKGRRRSSFSIIRDAKFRSATSARVVLFSPLKRSNVVAIEGKADLLLPECLGSRATCR